jgi:hypothetical protein
MQLTERNGEAEIHTWINFRCRGLNPEWSVLIIIKVNQYRPWRRTVRVVWLNSFTTSARDRGGWTTTHTVCFTLGKETQHSLYRGLGGPRGRSGTVRKTSPPPGFEPRTAQYVVTRHTKYAMSAATDRNVGLLIVQHHYMLSQSCGIVLTLLAREVATVLLIGGVECGSWGKLTDAPAGAGGSPRSCSKNGRNINDWGFGILSPLLGL